MLIQNRRGARLNRRGIALPLALLGLVAVSLLVTTALLTSSTQTAISSAQQTASRNLYNADAALESYLSSRSSVQANNALDSVRTTHTFNGTTFNVTVSRLRRDQDTTFGTPTRVQRNEIFSLLVSPQNTGRSVGAIYKTETEWFLGQLNINSAGAVAANILRIPGNSGAMSGVDESGCSDMYTGNTGGTDALAISDSVILDMDTARVLEAADGSSRVERTGLSRTAFALQVLGGLTPEQLATTASIRWGTALPAADGGTVDGRSLSGKSSLNPDPSNSRQSWENWGCPAGTQPSGEEKLEERSISSSACDRAYDSIYGAGIRDSAYYPVVAVRSPGGQFKIQGYGQGVLIVFGDVDLRDLNWFGVVVVTGDVQLNGTGYIGGAFVALGDATLGVENQQSGGEVVDWTGRTFVRFNRCGLNAAQTALSKQNEESARQDFTTGTIDWFEVVR